MMHKIKHIICLLTGIAISFGSFAQTGNQFQQLANEAYSDSSYQQIIRMFFQSDTAVVRNGIRAVRISALHDSTTGGASMRAAYDPNCNLCEQLTFDNNGHLLLRIDHHSYDFAVKDQYVYEDNSDKVKYLLHFKKQPINEYDTSWHLFAFSIINNYSGFSISKDYFGNFASFSATPTQKPVSTITSTYDAKGKMTWSRLQYKNQKDSVTSQDSTYITYTNSKTVAKTYDRKKKLLSTITTTPDSSRFVDITNDRIETCTVARSGNKPTSITTISSGTVPYDAHPKMPGTYTGTITYNDKGLPQQIIFKTGGEYCVLVFYYTYISKY